MDGERWSRDRAMVELAARQRGVVAMWQLRGLDVTDDVVQARVEHGLLYRVFRGVLSLTPSPREEMRGKRGAKKIRAVLAEWAEPEPTKSGLEQGLRDLCREYDIPLPARTWSSSAKPPRSKPLAIA